jgi:hypothetical protein
MYKIIYFLLAATMLGVQSHAQKNNADLYSGYVNYEPGAGPGMITLISTGFGKKKVESIKDSYQEAFSALLFRGIPGSEYEFPMIPAENNKQEAPAVKSLLQDGYMSFVTATALQSEDKKVKRKDDAKGIMVKQKITINCEALRRHLEQNNIIRKFGI